MRPIGFLLGLGALWISASAWADNAHLALAEKLATELKFAEAGSELDQAWQASGNDRPTVLRILELEGVVAGSLRQAKRAEASFRKLVALDPNHELSSDYAPRVMTPFYEAKSWVGEHGSLRFMALKPDADETTLHGVRAGVRADPFNMGQTIRFHVRPKGGPWNTLQQPLDQGQALARIEAPAVEWWAELVGENDAQLALLGSEAAPLVAEIGPTKLAAVPTTAPTAEPELIAPPQRRTEAARAAAAEIAVTATEGPQYRPAAYGLIASGVAILGAGIYFGVRSSNDLSQINSATRDSSGTVTGMTQKLAYSLNSDSKTSAVVGNVLMGAGAAVAVAGGAVYWLGRETPVTVAVGPSGIAVAGSFR